MREIRLALIGGAIALIATPALASIVVVGPYKSYGACNSDLSHLKKLDPSSSYYTSNGYTFDCQQVNGAWYIVAV